MAEETGTLWQRFQLWRELRAQGIDAGWWLPSKEEYRSLRMLDQEATPQVPSARAHSDATTEGLKQEMRDITEQAEYREWSVRNDGIVSGERGNQMASGGMDFEAPRIHPVWADEGAHEARTLESMGEATFVSEPLYRQLEAWAEAAVHPDVDAWTAYLMMTGPEYDQWLAGGEERDQVEQQMMGRAAEARLTGEVPIVNPYGNTSFVLHIPEAELSAADLDKREPDARREIDTSDADMGTAWHKTFEQLSARLEALNTALANCWAVKKRTL